MKHHWYISEKKEIHQIKTKLVTKFCFFCIKSARTKIFILLTEEMHKDKISINQSVSE